VTWWEVGEARECGPEETGEVCAGQTLISGYESCNAPAQSELIKLTDRTSTLQVIENESEAEGGVVNGGIVNGGADVFRLAACDDPENAHIAQLGTIDAPLADHLVQRIPAELQSLVTCPDGRLFGVVLGLHSLNQLFFNQEILENSDVKERLVASQIDLGQPLELEQLPLLLKALDEAGYERPLVIQDDPGTWSRFLIENIMVALSTRAYGYDSYKSFWARLAGGTAGPQTINLDLFEAALEFASRLAPYIQVAGNPLATIATTTDTARTRGVLTINGDWAAATLPSGLGFRRFPGTEGFYVYTTDVAVATRKRNEPLSLDATAPVVGLFKAITSAQVQTLFARRKYSLSPVTFVNGSTIAKPQDELFVVDGTALVGVPGLPSYVPYRTFDELESKVQDYMACLTEKKPSENAAASTSAILAKESRERCSGAYDELVDYVHDQYCTVISGSEDGCVDVSPLPRKEPR
jgi:hypothetical protein